MTVKDLKKAIADLPDQMDVMVEQTNCDFQYGMSETIKVRSVSFSAPDIPKKEWATLKCLVISGQF